MSTSAEPITPWGLTQREIDVMETLCTYGSNDASARALSISRSQMETHLRQVRARMGVDDRLLMALNYQRWRLTMRPAAEAAAAAEQPAHHRDDPDHDKIATTPAPSRRYAGPEPFARKAILKAIATAPADIGIDLTGILAATSMGLQSLRVTLCRLRQAGLVHFVAENKYRITYYPTEAAREAAVQALAQRRAAAFAEAHPPKPPEPVKASKPVKTVKPIKAAAPIKKLAVDGPVLYHADFKHSIFETKPDPRRTVTEPITSGFASMGIGRYLKDRT